MKDGKGGKGGGGGGVASPRFGLGHALWHVLKLSEKGLAQVVQREYNAMQRTDNYPLDK